MLQFPSQEHRGCRITGNLKISFLKSLGKTLEKAR